MLRAGHMTEVKGGALTRLPLAMVHDYAAWRALGPGGLPANPAGWAVASALRLVTRDTTSAEVYAGALSSHPIVLPTRMGGRPRISPHPVPHRQLDQLGSPPLQEATRKVFAAMVRDRPTVVRPGLSRLERGGDALFTRDLRSAPWLGATHGEIGHVHRSDGSLHLALPLADAAVVVGAGWGERHPFAGLPGLSLPLGYLLVYAPRDHDEIRVVRRLLERAAGVRRA